MYECQGSWSYRCELVPNTLYNIVCSGYDLTCYVILCLFCAIESHPAQVRSTIICLTSTYHLILQHWQHLFARDSSSIAMHLFRILSPLDNEIHTREHHSCESLTSYVTLLVVLHPSSLSPSLSDATVQRALDELNRHQWVHLACHGMPNRQKTFESSFAMHDGPLTITDIIPPRFQQPEFAQSGCLFICTMYMADLRA